MRSVILEIKERFDIGRLLLNVSLSRDGFLRRHKYIYVNINTFLCNINVFICQQSKNPHN